MTLKPITPFCSFLAGFVLLAAPAPAEEIPLDQEAIEYRKHIMNTLDSQFKAIAAIVAFNGPAENLRSHLEAALVTADMVGPSFEKRMPGGTSQSYLWDQWSDYTRHMRQFEAALAMAIEAAKFGSVTDVVWYTDQISCRKCHDIYRLPRIGREEYLGY